MLSIALTKGRLEKESVRMFERCGYGVEELKNKGRQLVFHDTVKDNRYFLVKAADSVTYVEHGVADIGFVGKDTLMEANGKYYEMMDLGIGKCGFIVAALPGCSPFEKIGHIKIGSKYPNVARSYFRSRGMDVEVIRLASGEMIYRMVFLGANEERLCAALIDRDGLDALRDVIAQIIGDRP